ncbi:MAG: hypothetical protein LBR82_09265 [Desulfovibrio sp.]|jgi:hypothetical protein|nr:hypothetical protein [Desulfovibrio sp.]
MSETGTETATDRHGYWIERAECDLETAQAMQQTARYLYVCLCINKQLKKH